MIQPWDQMSLGQLMPLLVELVKTVAPEHLRELSGRATDIRHPEMVALMRVQGLLLRSPANVVIRSERGGVCLFGCRSDRPIGWGFAGRDVRLTPAEIDAVRDVLENAASMHPVVYTFPTLGYRKSEVWIRRLGFRLDELRSDEAGRPVFRYRR
jgi:hypothetical protein